jgi:hypothetical protein
MLEDAMSRDDIIRMARQAGFVANVSEEPYAKLCHPTPTSTALFNMLERLFHMAQAAERNKLAQWMMTKGYATGHGDTVEDLLRELEWQVRESERNACAAIARQWDVDHQGSNYGGCIARLIEARGRYEQTAQQERKL